MSMTHYVRIVLTRENEDEDGPRDLEYKLDIDYRVLKAEPSVGWNVDIEIEAIQLNRNDFEVTPEELEWIKQTIYDTDLF